MTDDRPSPAPRRPGMPAGTVLLPLLCGVLGGVVAACCSGRGRSVSRFSSPATQTAGSDATVPAIGLPAAAAAPAEAAKTDAEAIRETLANVRTISTVRFVAFPFFLGASGVLAKVFHEAGAAAPPAQAVATAGLGLGLALVALVFETVFSRNLKCWWDGLLPYARRPPWHLLVAHRDPATLWVARCALVLPYAACAGWWTARLLQTLAVAAEPWGGGGPPGRTWIALGVTALAFAVPVRVWQRARPFDPTRAPVSRAAARAG